MSEKLPPGGASRCGRDLRRELVELLEQAHAYAYGGCIIQDLGYYRVIGRADARHTRNDSAGSLDRMPSLAVR